MAQSEFAYLENGDELTNRTDNELAISAKQGNKEDLEYIFNKYKELVNM